MGSAESEWERVMRGQEVMMRALSGEMHWFQAAAILGVDVRTMRRWRVESEHRGCHALFFGSILLMGLPMFRLNRQLWLVAVATGALLLGTMIVAMRKGVG